MRHWSPRAQQPAHERVIRTLREWGVRLDEALFLGDGIRGHFWKLLGRIFSSTIRSTILTVPASIKVWRPGMFRMALPTIRDEPLLRLAAC